MNMRPLSSWLLGSRDAKGNEDRLVPMVGKIQANPEGMNRQAARIVIIKVLSVAIEFPQSRPI